ncbi:MAG: hypothetical protein ACLGHT_06560 [Acidimicrobiia bacterium]
MLAVTDPSIGDGPVWLVELGRRYPSEKRPVADRCIEVEALVEVKANPQPRLVHLEEVAEPPDKEDDEVRIRVGEQNLPVCL